MSSYITLLEMIGTVAFALAGAVKAAECRLDLFGVMIVGVTTATGGGIFRDLVLGKTPPSAFTDPMYVEAAAITSAAVFLFMYVMHGKMNVADQGRKFFDAALLAADSAGLGIFTAMGVLTAWQMYPQGGVFLYVFSGVITGVGGGLFRDIFLRCLPDIFCKHIYACASLAGALLQVWMFEQNMVFTGIWTGTAAVIMIRLLAAKYRWSLPRIPQDPAAGSDAQV